MKQEASVEGLVVVAQVGGLSKGLDLAQEEAWEVELGEEDLEEEVVVVVVLVEDQVMVEVLVLAEV